MKFSITYQNICDLQILEGDTNTITPFEKIVKEGFFIDMTKLKEKCTISIKLMPENKLPVIHEIDCQLKDLSIKIIELAGRFDNEMLSLIEGKKIGSAGMQPINGDG